MHSQVKKLSKHLKQANQLPTSLPVWFEDSKSVANLNAGELMEKEDL